MALAAWNTETLASCILRAIIKSTVSVARSTLGYSTYPSSLASVWEGSYTSLPALVSVITVVSGWPVSGSTLPIATCRRYDPPSAVRVTSALAMLREISSMNACCRDIPAALTPSGPSSDRMGREPTPPVGSATIADRGAKVGVALLQQPGRRLVAQLRVGQGG